MAPDLHLLFISSSDDRIPADTRTASKPVQMKVIPSNETGNDFEHIRFGIATNIIVLITALVVMTTIIISAWIFHRFNTELINRKFIELKAEARVQGGRLKSEIDELVLDVSFLASTPPVQGILRSSKTGGIDPLDGSTEEIWKERLQIIFVSMLNSVPDYTQVSYIGVADNGRELVRVDRYGKNGAIRVVPQHELQGKGDTRYFRQTLMKPAGEVYVSEIELNREHGEITVPHSPVIRASIPVYDSNHRKFGMLIINKNINLGFDNLLDSDEKDLTYMITNGRGDYLYHPDAGKTFRFEYGESVRIQDDYPEIAGMYAPDGMSETSFIHHGTISNSLISMKQLNNLPFENNQAIGIAVSQEVDLVLGIARQIREQAYSILFVIILLVMFAGSLFARKIARPILDITRAVQQFGRGRREVNFPVDADGEPGILARSFAEMIERVNLREESLKIESMERKKAEKQVKAILDNAVDAIITIDTSGTILSVNRAAVRIFGYDENEMIGKNVKILMPQPYRGEHDSYLSNYLSTGEKKIIGIGREVTGLRKDGTVFPMELSVSETRLGKDISFTGFVRDVTERKSAEENIRITFNAAPNALVMTNSNGEITLVNEALLKMFGYQGDELLGSRIEMLIPGNFRENHQKLRADFLGKPSRRTMGAGRDLYGLRKDGVEIPVEIGLNPISTNQGVMVISSIVDITERKTAEQIIQRQVEELRRSNQELEQFAYVASHDLQEPLRMVSSYMSLLSRRYQGQLDEDADKYIHFAIDGAKRMQILIQDLLKYSRVSTHQKKFSTVNCNLMFEEALENLSVLIRESGTRVTREELPEVSGDSAQIMQLFQNLVGNAVKYRDPDRQNTVHVSANAENGHIRFCIEDNGIGIASEYHERIFIIFKRLFNKTEYEGTGIGLAICKRIVESHNGRIWLESEPGKGTRFYFTLQRASASTETPSLAVGMD